MLFGIFRCKEGNYIERIQVSNDIDEYLNDDNDYEVGSMRPHK